MPQNPSTWAANFQVTAKQLNTSLYTIGPGYGNDHQPNGILFHALPPLAMSNLTAALIVASSAGGVSTSMASVGNWRCSIDNSCYFGAGADFMGLGAAGHFIAAVAGSAGLTNNITPQAGGWYLSWGVCAIGPMNGAGAFGAQLWNNGSTAAFGGVQLNSTTHDQAAYVFDLQQITPPANTNLGAYLVDATNVGANGRVNTADYMGNTALFGTLWSAPLASNSPTVASSLPVPTTGYTGASVITSAGLNGNGLAQPLAFLNNPPQVRAAGSPVTSIPNNGVLTGTAVPLTTAPLLDSWSGFSVTTSLYTAPVSGVYLVHAVVNYAANATAQRVCGLIINGATTLWGPSHQAAASGVTRPQIIRLLDLNANDTIGVVTGQNTGAALALSNSLTSRMIVRFVSAQGASNGGTTWTVPDPTHRYVAGSSGLVADFNRVGNDLSFLIQRPYLMAYQSVAQAAQTQNQFNLLTMDQLKGRVHATAGDNYGGWTSGASNRYAAVVPGWYLCVLNGTQAPPTVTPSWCTAGIGYYTAGGVAQGSSAQQFGQHVPSSSTSFAPGAEAIGLYYLRAGDYVQPFYRQESTAVYATSVAQAGQESSFGVVWVSE